MNGVLLRCVETLEKKLKHLLTLRRSFPCDSHPRMCMACIKLRFRVKHNKMPRFVVLETKMGKFIYMAKGLRVHIVKGNTRMFTHAIRI